MQNEELMRARRTSRAASSPKRLETGPGETGILNRIGRIFLSVPSDEMYADVLQIVLGVMKSPDGVFGYIDENRPHHGLDDQGNLAGVPDGRQDDPLSQGGLGRQYLVQGAVAETVDLLQSRPRELPAGHIPIRRPAWWSPWSTRTRPSATSRWPTRRPTTRPRTWGGWNALRPISLPALQERVRHIQERHRRQAEAALGESEEKFRAIANYTVDWENWLGPDLELLWVSPSVERITGYSAAECYAMRDYPLPLIAAEDRGRLAEMYRHAHGQRGEDLEIPHCPQGRFHPLGFRRLATDLRCQRRLSGAPGRPRDITDSKRAEEELRKVSSQLAHLNRLHTVGEMAAALAHELNQPLYAINNYVRGIERRLKKQHALPDLDLMSDAIDHVSREVSRAAAIVANLRRFVRDHAPSDRP